jgi:hypothetical protein
MKLTKETLKKIIKEELQATLREEDGDINPDHVRALLNDWWDSDDPINMSEEQLWREYSQNPNYLGLSKASFEEAIRRYDA